jgi:hypothetical protein
MKPNDYDGFYFLPDESDDDLQIAYFNFKDEFANGKPIEHSSIGYKYHIAFFKRDDKGNPVFDDTFEAIFGDPTIYIKNLVGAGLYGCVLKKTEKSQEWFDEYLERAFKRLQVVKMIDNLKAIAETK